MAQAQLLAVVEVPRDDRVRCQAAGCNHSVFRRIHVVRLDNGVQVYGSECFKKLFIGQPIASAVPTYTSSEGRSLTEQERQLLVENTQRLIQQFEAEHQASIERAKALAKPAMAPPPSIDASLYPRVRFAARAERKWTDPLEEQAKANVRAQYGIDPDLPGWRGLVLAEIRRLRRHSAG